MIVEGYISPLEDEIEKSCYSCKHCRYSFDRHLHFCSLDFDPDCIDNQDVVFPYMYCERFSPFILE